MFAFLITLSLSWRAFVSRRSNNTSFTTIVDAADGDDDHTRHTSHALLQITRTHVRTLSIVPIQCHFKTSGGNSESIPETIPLLESIPILEEILETIPESMPGPIPGFTLEFTSRFHS